MDRIFAQNLLARLEKELLDKTMREIKKAEQGHFNQKGTIYDPERYLKKIERLIEGNFELKTLDARIKFLRERIKDSGNNSDVDTTAKRWSYGHYDIPYVQPTERHFNSFRI